MTEAESRQGQATYAEADEKNLGKLSQNSNEAEILWQETLVPEAIEQLEIQRRWALILGSIGVV